MRLKIILGNLLIVAAVGLVAFAVVRQQLQEGLAKEIDSRIGNDRILFERSWRLSAVEFLEHVADRAGTRDVQAIFTALDEEGRRQRAHRAANSISRWFMDPARGRQGGPDVVAITDQAGRVVARDKDINRMHGHRLVQVLPNLRKVLNDGHARHDVWRFQAEEKLLQTGMAPVTNASGAVVGAVVVGYELSTGLAERESEVLGRELAFLHDGEIYSASVPSEQIEPLQKTLFGRLKDRAEAALAGQPTGVWSVDLAGGGTYVGVAARLPQSSSTPVAYAVLADRTEHMELVSVSNFVLLLTVLGALGVLIYGWVIGGSFIRPLEQIEEDVLKVINGRTDLRIDVESAEFGGLAYRINQLINVFTGVSEEDEEGRVSQTPAAASAGGAGGSGGSGGWQGAAFGSETGGGGGGGARTDPIDDPEVGSKLEAEAADQYYDRLHSEYVAAKQAAGEDVSNIPKDRFIQRIQGNERALAHKHGVRMVRFQVEASGAQVVLRPVLIR